jgi:WD40 repeat protein
MADVHDNNDVSPDESKPLLDASAAGTGWPIDKDGPFPEIDGYEIIEAMQAGGQGKLFKARELTPSGREVVLKFPRAGAFSSDRAVALFENEVHKAASLDHPNIARIYSSGQYDRMPFYSMEFIDGADLDEYVKEADLGQRDILELVRTVCLAVQHAHQRQLVHRDLKPANVMVTRDGAVPKLLDFGLAIEETDLQATVDRGVGTLLYMSPEQAAYESVTTQTDVYSLGVILYEFLTGEHPHWSADQDGQTISPGQFRDRIANGEPIRPRRVSKHIDQELEALILKALAHDPEDRYRSAGDMAADINNYLTGEPLTAKAPTTIYFLRKRLRKHRARVAIAAGVLALLLGVSVFAYVSVTSERDRALTAEDEAVVAKQAEDKQREFVAKDLYRDGISEADRLSLTGKCADARELLTTLKPSFRGWEYGHLMCRSVRRGFGELLTLKGHSGRVQSVAFSTGGRYLASGSEDMTIKLWDTATGKDIVTFKGHSGVVRSIAFSPDGKRLASGSWDKTIKLWDTVTGKELLTLKGHSDWVRSTAFSPDGKCLASGSWDKTIKLWDTATGKDMLTLKGHSGMVQSTAFSPDGKCLASGSWDKTIKLWDTSTGKEILTLNGHSGVVQSVAFSPDGKLLASGSADKTIKLWDTVTGKELLTLKGHSGVVQSVAFSPGGKRLVSGSRDRTIKLWDTATGKDIFTLKGHSDEVASIAFSPDGKQLASGGGDRTIKLWNTLEWTKPEVPSAELYVNIGNAYSKQRQYADAIVACEKAISIKPDCAEAYCVMGAAYTALDKHADAIAACEKAISNKPDCAEAYCVMGAAYIALNKHDDAIVACKKSISIKPDYAEAHFNMGKTCERSGNHADAIAAYKETIAIKPDYAEAHFNMGKVYERLRRRADAIVAYKEAIAIKPNYAWEYVRQQQHLRVAKRILDTRIGKMDFDDMELSQVFQFLSNVSGAYVHAKWRALAFESIEPATTVNLHLSNVSFRQTMETILADVATGYEPGVGKTRLDYIIDGGVVIISTKSDLAKPSLFSIVAAENKKLPGSGNVVWDYIGMEIRDIDERVSRSFDLTNTDGVMVTRIDSNSPAMMAGMARGDVVVSIGEKNTKNTSELQDHVATLRRGEIVKVKLYRKGKVKTVTLKIAEAK